MDTVSTISSLNRTYECVNLSFDCEVPAETGNLYNHNKNHKHRDTFGNVILFSFSVRENGNNIERQVLGVLEYHLKHNTTSKAAEDSAKLINNSAGVTYKLPETKYLLRKHATSAFVQKYYIKCLGCNEFTAIECNSNGKYTGQCYHCAKNISKTKNSYFVYIPIEQQLRESIARNWNDIMKYADVRKEIDSNADQTIFDIHDGKVFQDIQKKYPETFNLSVVVNTDGVKLFDRTTFSLWPILLYQNFLPPKIRYVTDNILLVGLIYIDSERSLNFQSFFMPLLKEIRDIQRAGGFTIEREQKTICFRPFITHSCCDLPAKAMLQGMLRYNGYHACGYCHHPGVSVKNKNNDRKYCRYVKRDTSDKLRNHDEVILSLAQIANGTKDEFDGLKSVSCMVAASEFDMVNGFGIDYMHCIAIGVTTTVWDLWFSPKNSKSAYYVEKKDQKILNARLLRIKPISEFKRRPKSMEDRQSIQANDKRYCLLYYLRYSLSGVLGTEYVSHFQLLSAATYILSKKCISMGEINSAREMLTQFADDFEKLYGKEAVTMNVHLLRHIPEAVIHLGPLWAQSLFGFEAMNGVLSRMVKSPMHPIDQIATKYIMRMSVKAHKIEEQKPRSVICSFREKLTAPTIEEELAFLQEGINIEKIQIWQRIQLNGIFYSSSAYRDTSFIDYFVSLLNERMGKIKYFIQTETVVYALVENFVEEKRSNHLVEVISTNSFSLFNVSKIGKKLLFLKIGLREIVCDVPNNYEKS